MESQAFKAETMNIEDLLSENGSLREENFRLREENQQLRFRLKELEERLSKDSHNSSKPPSTDPPHRKRKTKSIRKSSGRKPGGQEGHEGATLRQVENPDVQEVHFPTGLCDCGRPLSEASAEMLPERRQTIELEIRSRVVEHRVAESVCACGRRRRADFPAWVKSPIQYGPSVSALSSYLTQYQLLPYGRSAEMLQDLFGIGISPATIHAANRSAADLLAPPMESVHQALVKARVAHADETGVRINGVLHWLHVLSTPEMTGYWIHPKRGKKALEDIGLLPRFSGTLVHDHWAAYRAQPCIHAMCNAHHLRELVGIAESTGQEWPEKMIDLLTEAKAEADEARKNGLPSLEKARVEHFHQIYRQILEEGEALNPPNAKPPGKKGRAKQTPAHNLLLRLRKYQTDTLRFLSDLKVPFDNNQAERDLRMPKCKQKISGSFRSKEGAEAFALIRSYVSTLRKQSVNILEALSQAFQGNPPVPAVTES
jgi:transposase